MDDYLSTNLLNLDPEAYSDNQSWFLLSDILFSNQINKRHKNRPIVDKKETTKLPEQKNLNFYS